MALIGLVGRPAFGQENEAWLRVDTQTLTLTVLAADEQELETFANISIGRRGTTRMHLRGDKTTPLGTYHVVSINPKSRYGIYFGFDYPSREQAEQAFADGRLPRTDYLSIVTAHDQGLPPPQTTALGGMIGIHGLGAGNVKIHGLMNWTNGCVALTNEQIQALAKWVRIGTKVEIR